MPRSKSKCDTLFTFASLFAVLVAVAIVPASTQRSSDPFSRDRRVTAELVAVSPGNPGSAAVTLRWNSFHNTFYPLSQRDSHTDEALGNIETVTAYETQYSVSGSGNWITLATSSTGLRGAPAGSITPQVDSREKQRIFTRADAGQLISDGFFRLTLSYAGESLLDTELQTITPPIPFDASEAQMKAALESLDLVSQVQVFRTADPVNDGGVVSGVGAYEWVVLFDRVTTSPDDNGDLPLLALYTETVSAVWNGAGDQVAIQSVRERERGRIVCSNECLYDIAALPAGVEYAFRVRAHFAQLGWSEWSPVTEPLQTPATLLPTAPMPPVLVVATITHIKIKWLSVPAWSPEAERTLFPILRYRAQQKCTDDLTWTTISDNIQPSSTAYTALRSVAREPNRSCIFRVAATNANGDGPFSSPSIAFSTLAATPGVPVAIRVTSEPNQLLWRPPSTDGGSAIVRYDVQYREMGSSAWIQAGGTDIDLKNPAWDFSTRVSWKPYTYYIARVRAVNAIGEGEFSVSEPFLTPYRANSSPYGESKGDSSDNYTIISTAAVGATAANTIDRYYVQATANGGTQGDDGQHGVVVVFPIVLSGARLSERTFFFTGTMQSYRVPDDHAAGTTTSSRTAATSRVVAIDVFAWGAGGGSGSKDNSGGLSDGGGGAFVRARFRVAPGDRLEVVVGGGGQGSSQHVERRSGGYNGGGDGGRGEYPSGGGGGASEVRINSKTVLVAAAGGGGGATDYCCAHGGGGGGARIGERAEDGSFPGPRSIPLDITAAKNTASSVVLLGPRDEYHSHNVEGDDRDWNGLPARHQHLDYGFAGPQADYSILSTGGSGASIQSPGTAGQASSFQFSRFGKCYWNAVNNPVGQILQVAAPWNAVLPSSGQRGRGGHGQDGKDAGGGGGGGYFGGGGGGAGIDGAGGGGGSSFVLSSELFQEHNRPLQRLLRHDSADRAVVNFQATSMSSTSVLLMWKCPRYGFSEPIEGFTVEMANRSISEDFRTVRSLWATPPLSIQDITNTTIDNLAPKSSYRFRVKTLFRNSPGLYSEVQVVSTRATPRNVWHRVNGDSDVRSFAEEDTAAGIRYTDPIPLRRFPSARRGHTLTSFANYLYLFGGFLKGYLCNRGHKLECITDAGVSNELWRFDPVVNMWMEIGPATAIPPARERHSMSVVGDRVLLFGGLQGSPDGVTTPSALNDLWELSITSTTRRTTASLSDLESNLRISDGAELFTIGNAGSAPDMCVISLNVTMQITHRCPHSLRIELLGPGPSSFPQRQQSTEFPVNSQAQEREWSDQAGFSWGPQRTTPTTPSARAFSVVLKTPESAPDKVACVSGTQVFNFSSSDDTVSGSSTPHEPLSVFHQFVARGGWTLSISDTSADGLEGVLDKWDIRFELAPCVPSFEWKNVTAIVAGKAPSPRFEHTAIVYENSMFVYGGRNGSNRKSLSDLYRLDYSSSGVNTVAAQWVQLVSATSSTSATDEKRYHSGRRVMLTPFELITVTHGLRSPRQMTGVRHHFDSGMYSGRKQVASPRLGWRRLELHAVDADDITPAPRYWSAFAFVTVTPRSLTTPSSHHVYMFAGQDDTSMFDDFWQLDLDLLAEQAPLTVIDSYRRQTCDWRLSSVFFQGQWTTSCGANSSLVLLNQAKECSLDDILLYAWCKGFYQTMLF